MLLEFDEEFELLLDEELLLEFEDEFELLLEEELLLEFEEEFELPLDEELLLEFEDELPRSPRCQRRASVQPCSPPVAVSGSSSRTAAAGTWGAICSASPAWAPPAVKVAAASVVAMIDFLIGLSPVGSGCPKDIQPPNAPDEALFHRTETRKISLLAAQSPRGIETRGSSRWRVSKQNSNGD